MDPDLAGFMRMYLSVEVAYSTLASLKGTIRSASWCDDVQQRFGRMLAERNMTRGEYCENTWIDFDTDEEMYEYLEKLHAYLFLDQGDFPLPPD
ncbi:hypothetical protein ACIOJE_23845 [Kitasatospora sp. NPDC087861]|uniref:hypothetical protein n=1 Tax=Kitasatospora sp. NPDC087861 TaxID=3364070 RepID=UPI0038209F63